MITNFGLTKKFLPKGICSNASQLIFTDSFHNFFFAETNNWHWTNQWSFSNEVNINSLTSLPENSFFFKVVK